MAGDQVARSNINPFPIVNKVWLATCQLAGLDERPFSAARARIEPLL
jgi:hypothetical protein